MPNSNPTITGLQTHRSIRKYKDTPIDEVTLNTILESALRASSSGNMQMMSVIVTKDTTRKQKLWELHLEQDMILQAPVLLTFCADFHRMTLWCEQSDAEPGYDNFYSFMKAVGDTFIAAQNAAIAAESLGLGICYMGTTLYSCTAIAEFLQCPKHVVPITTLVVGHPNESPALRDRLPLSSIVHTETYQDFLQERITQTYQDREHKGWARYMEIPYLKKMAEDAGAKNLAQIYTKAKYTKTDNYQKALELLDLLKRQGFMNQS